MTTKNVFLWTALLGVSLPLGAAETKDAILARMDAAAGDLGGAIARWRSVADRLPLPEYVIGLGEAELAAGRTAAGERDLQLVGAERLDHAVVRSGQQQAGHVLG